VLGAVRGGPQACASKKLLVRRIITVAARKGGVGKTTLAYELAAALDAVLVDLDWDEGGASAWWSAARPTRSRLLDALERGPDGTPPKPRRAPGRPDLVPSHPDLAASRVEPDWLADCLIGWATAWARPVVVDTHPGASALTDGAIAAADVVLVPTVLGPRELNALAGMVDEMGVGFPLALVPNMVPAAPPRKLVERLEQMATGHTVLSPIHDHRILRRRLRRTALVLEHDPGRDTARAQAELLRLADQVAQVMGEIVNA
jgi:chromosome partitioning protein